MLWLSLLIACGNQSGAESSTPVSPNADLTHSTTPPTSSTPTQTANPSELVQLQEVSPVSSVRLGITGVKAECDGDEAFLFAEIKGRADSFEVLEILNNEVISSIPLTFNTDPKRLFHDAEANAVVTDCENTTWAWIPRDSQPARCVVSGPQAAAVVNSALIPSASCRTW